MNGTSTLAAHGIHSSYRKSLLALADAISPYPFLRKSENDLRNIAANLQSPFSIAVFGRMKTGKSSLINALIGKQLAITGVEEATATINKLTYTTGDRLNQFTVHWHEKEPDTYPIDRLKAEWSGKAPEVLERVDRAAWLELFSDAPMLKNIHVIDTPGTGATADKHEEVARQFINGQEADALLYVFSPNGRESDEENLAAFRAGCLPGASLDNSVAVLHKWDDIYWNEDNLDSILSKAARVQDFMKDLVSAVIPVSAPLALVARTAPESFWTACQEVLQTFASVEELRRALLKDILWKRKSAQHDEVLRTAYELGCPWVSFCVLMRHLFRNPDVNPAETILKLSGMKELETLLDKQIFSMRSVIQQRQNCARARRVMDVVYKGIEAELQRQQNDAMMLERLYDQFKDKETAESLWLDRKRAELLQLHAALDREYCKLDYMRIGVAEWSDTITNALDLLHWLQDEERLSLNDEQAQQFRSILRSLLPNAEAAKDVTLREAVALQPVIGRLARLPEPADQIKAGQLRQCLMQWCKRQTSTN